MRYLLIPLVAYILFFVGMKWVARRRKRFGEMGEVWINTTTGVAENDSQPIEIEMLPVAIQTYIKEAYERGRQEMLAALCRNSYSSEEWYLMSGLNGVVSGKNGKWVFIPDKLEGV